MVEILPFYSLTQEKWVNFDFFALLVHTGFAFIYMEDERDAEDAIRGLDRREFGRKGRRLRVEWTKVIYMWYDVFVKLQNLFLLMFHFCLIIEKEI